MNNYVLGVDGDRNGAACLLGPEGDARLLGCWTQRARGYELVVGWRIGGRTAGPVQLVRYTAPGAASLGALLAEQCRKPSAEPAYHLAAEDVFVRPGGHRQNIGTSLRLARWTGALVAGLERHAVGDMARWVMATAWRARVLGLQRTTPREQAKRASMTLMPARVPGLEDLLSVVGRTHGATDAAGIACWLRSEVEEEARQVEIRQLRHGKRRARGVK